MPDVPQSQHENRPNESDKISFPSHTVADIYSSSAVAFMPKHYDKVAANEAAVKAGTLPSFEIQGGAVPAVPHIRAFERDITVVQNARHVTPKSESAHDSQGMSPQDHRFDSAPAPAHKP